MNWPAKDSRYADGDPDPAKVLAEVAEIASEAAYQVAGLRHGLTDRLGSRIAAAAEVMAERLAAGGRLFTFGNGGSGAAAASLAARLRHPGGGARPLPATALTADAALLTGLTDTGGFEVVFERPLAALGRRGDIAIALSTAGGSANVMRGLEQAHRMRMVTVGLAGAGGGAMAESHAVDCLLVVPSVSPHRIQEAQMTLCHVLCELTRKALA